MKAVVEIELEDEGCNLSPEEIEELKESILDNTGHRGWILANGKAVHAESITVRVECIAAERDFLKIQADRYEKLRRINIREFGDLYERNIRGEGQFDDLVDQL